MMNYKKNVLRVCKLDFEVYSKAKICGALILLVLSCTAKISAQHTDHNHEVYSLDWKKDGALVGVGLGFTLLGDYMLGKADAPNLEDIALLREEDLWSIDKNATNNYSRRAETISDVILFGSATLPFVIYAFDKARGAELESFVMTLETFLITNGITNIVKAAVKRYRPYNYNPEVPDEIKLGKTSRRSFFSGHASNTAAFCFLTAQALNDMHPDWKTKKYLSWSLAATLPLVISYGRFEAGKHFPTDVLTAYLFGASVGVLIPKIHKKKNMQLEAGIGGLSLKIKL